MNYEYLNNLRKNHPSWRLINADSSPLIISFLNMTFMEKNLRPMRESELVEKLDEYLYHLHKIYGKEIYPKSPKEYLDDWSGGTNSFLRKYYPPVGDEPEFDITPATEKVIDWIKSIEKREFVGTESRLLLIFKLLEGLVEETEQDPEKRISDLKKKKEEIDREIEKIQSGNITNFDGRQIKENYWRIEDEVRNLLSDFREVEENFRLLDRQTREQIATSNLKKSELLDEIFKKQDIIDDSDQGKSFNAFWSFLLSYTRQEEMEKLIEKIINLKDIDKDVENSLLPDLKYYLLDAGDKVKRTLNNLNEQLRKFLDEKTWLENKRIMEIIQSIEQNAIECKNNIPKTRQFIKIDDPKPNIELPMMRSLFIPPPKPFIFENEFENAKVSINSDVLYNQHYIDEKRLRHNIQLLLNNRKQVSLYEVCDEFPIQKGLSEVLTYFVIASKDSMALIDTDRMEKITYIHENLEREVQIPLVIFTR